MGGSASWGSSASVSLSVRAGGGREDLAAFPALSPVTCGSWGRGGPRLWYNRTLGATRRAEGRGSITDHRSGGRGLGSRP